MCVVRLKRRTTTATRKLNPEANIICFLKCGAEVLCSVHYCKSWKQKCSTVLTVTGSITIGLVRVYSKNKTKSLYCWWEFASSFQTRAQRCESTCLAALCQETWCRGGDTDPFGCPSWWSPRVKKHLLWSMWMSEQLKVNNCYLTTVNCNLNQFEEHSFRWPVTT